MSPLSRFGVALVLILIALAGGTMGFYAIEGWSLSDSLYMTVVTVTTVGFAEVHPLSQTGRHFTIVLLVFSVFSLGYAVTVFIGYVFEGQIMQTVKERRMLRLTRRLRDHYIVCGAGPVGREVVAELKRARVRFVVIDKEPAVSPLSKDDSILFVQGDAEDDQVLLEAGIETANGLISALPSDEANLFVVFTARHLNAGLTIVVQASDERAALKLKKAGADRVISPIQIAGQRMASVMLRPSVVNYLDIVVGPSDDGMRMEEVTVDEGSPLVDKTLRETGIGEHTGAVVIGINDFAGQTRTNPSSNTVLSTLVLKERDVLIVLGSEEQITRLRSFVKKGS